MDTLKHTTPEPIRAALGSLQTQLWIEFCTDAANHRRAREEGFRTTYEEWLKAKMDKCTSMTRANVLYKMLQEVQTPERDMSNIPSHAHKWLLPLIGEWKQRSQNGLADNQDLMKWVFELARPPGFTVKEYSDYYKSFTGPTLLDADLEAQIKVLAQKMSAKHGYSYDKIVERATGVAIELKEFWIWVDYGNHSLFRYAMQDYLKAVSTFFQLDE